LSLRGERGAETIESRGWVKKFAAPGKSKKKGDHQHGRPLRAAHPRRRSHMTEKIKLCAVGNGVGKTSEKKAPDQGRTNQTVKKKRNRYLLSAKKLKANAVGIRRKSRCRYQRTLQGEYSGSNQEYCESKQNMFTYTPKPKSNTIGCWADRIVRGEDRRDIAPRRTV